VQVDPIKHTLKAPGIQLLKLKHDKPLSKSAFKFNLRRYTLAPVLQNARAFIPTAAAVLAGRYLDNTPGWSSLNEGEQQHRLALRAGRLAESIRNFHGVAIDGEEDGQVGRCRLTQ
jgi:hypothetical protein